MWHLEWPPFPCTFSEGHLPKCSASVSWEVRCQADRLFLGQCSGEPFKHLVAWTKKTNIQLSIDAKYVEKGVTQTGELEYGPNGDLWSSLFRLIDGAVASQRSSRSSHIWRMLANQRSSKTKVLFITCWRTVWRMSWPRRQRNVCCLS